MTLSCALLELPEIHLRNTQEYWGYSRVERNRLTPGFGACGMRSQINGESQRTKSEGGEAKRWLVDFFIGANASLHADRLFTLDPHR